MGKYVIMLTLWSYFLGPWEIGPFTDYRSCEALRQYQLSHGITDVSVCEAVKDRYEVAAPLYGAPLAPREYERRQHDE